MITINDDKLHFEWSIPLIKRFWYMSQYKSAFKDITLPYAGRYFLKVEFKIDNLHIYTNTLFSYHKVKGNRVDILRETPTDKSNKA